MADEARSAEHDLALAGAARLHAGGDSAGALEILPDLVAARPDHLDTRLLLARCLVAVGAPAVARAAAEAAVEIDPSSWQAHLLVARAARETDPPAAIASAERAVALAPAEPEAHRVLAEVSAGSPGGATTSPTDALLAAARPDPSEGARSIVPTLPLALRGVTPETPAPPTPVLAEQAKQADDATGDERVRREPVLPKALGGTGLAGSTLTSGDAPEREKIGAGRLVFRLIGLVGWLLIGFRFGVQGIGGPIGLLLFAAIVGGVAYGSRRLTTR